MIHQRHRLTASLALAGACGLAAVGSLLAHPDDPKWQDTKPRYEGPGWRRDDNNPLPGGEFPAQNVELMSWVTLPEFPGNQSGAMGCWGYTSASGREYAIIGMSNGTGFVEVTNPGNAQIVGVIPGPNSGWREVTVYGDYCYSVNESDAGIQVIDMRQIDQGVVSHVRNVTTGGATQTHTIAVNPISGYLYRNGGNGNGLRIYSLADPSNPQYVTQWQDRYVHNCLPFTFTEGPNAGREIVFACGGFNGGWEQTGLTILDVTNKSNIVTLDHYQYPNAGYSHQCWITADRQHLVLDDELDEVFYGGLTNSRVIDVSDLSNPVQVATFTTGTTAIDHDQFIRGHALFQANYTSGLRVFNVSNPLAPVQVGYFDTWPQNDTPDFNSLWGNYPFFPSGTVIGSDREKGLFVWHIVPQETMTDITMVTGTNTAGDLDDVATSNNGYYQTRSGFGDTFSELHKMEMIVGASVDVGVPTVLDLTIESRLSVAGGTARIRLRDWSTGNFVTVHSYAIGTAEQSVTIPDVPAAAYVREGDGRVEMSIKHIVFVPFFAFQFDSFIDRVVIDGR